MLEYFKFTSILVLFFFILFLQTVLKFRKMSVETNENYHKNIFDTDKAINYNRLKIF
jgi:hypothetical protein